MAIRQMLFCGKRLIDCINFHRDCPIVIQTKASSGRNNLKYAIKIFFFFFFLCIGALNCSFGAEDVEQTKTLTSKKTLKHILTCPMEDESHMAVVYCLSSSGALSFRSNVSTATTTLDTWLGLSGRANQKQRSLQFSMGGL